LAKEPTPTFEKGLNMSHITVGTDTELFLRDAENNLLSAIKFISGSKHNPTILSNGGNVTHDNVALEFATPPVDNVQDFVKAIRDTMAEAFKSLPEGLLVLPIGSTEFPESELLDPRCREFGCEPDYDAWKLTRNEVPIGATERTFRSCGGHLHIGYVEDSGNDFLLDPYGKVAVIKALDIVAGIPFTIMDHSEDSINRRKLYGKAGCHRPTSYGVEYRTLSNYWAQSPKLVELVYSMAEDAVDIVREKRLQGLVNNIPEQTVVDIINNGDFKTASNLWKKYISKEVSEGTMKLFNKCCRKTYNLYKEWGL